MKALLLLLAAFLPFPAVSQFQPASYPRTRRDTTTTKLSNPLWKSTWTDKLKQDLLLNYDKFARPMQHNNKTTVTIDIAIRHVELDEKRSIMTVHCWVKMSWEDEKLKWDANNYGGLRELHLAEHEVWQPDVLPYNSASGTTIYHYGNMNVIALQNGTVLWVPPSIIHVFCQMDFTHWPFDIQVCHITMGSWTYSGEQVDLFSERHGQTFHEIPELIPNAEWEFVKMTVERSIVFYPCCTSPYVNVKFNLTLRRHFATYKALIITPASVVVFMTLAVFWLPPSSGDKILLAGSAAILTCLFILYFTIKMPMMAGTTPHIVVFYSRSLYLISFAIVIAVAVINIAKNPKSSALPWVLKRNLSGWVGKWLLIRCSEQQNSSKGEEMIDSQPVLSEQGRPLSESGPKGHQRDWVLLATAIDRVFFLAYCFAFVVLALMYSS